MESRISWDISERTIECSDSMIRTLDSSESPDEYDIMCLGVSIDQIKRYYLCRVLYDRYSHWIKVKSVDEFFFG